MRRTLATMAALLGAACTTTDLTRAGSSGPASAESSESSAERLGVPEQYRLHWNTTEPCSTEAITEGIQVYRHTDDARSLTHGTDFVFSANETWYWFHGDNDPADCRDTFRIDGHYLRGPYEALGCASCEVGYAVVRTLVERGCPYSYIESFGTPEGEHQEAPSTFEGFLLIDTHSSHDSSPHEDSRISITAHHLTFDRPRIDTDYVIRGMSRRVVSDPERVGPPSSYVWVGESCLTGL